MAAYKDPALLLVITYPVQIVQILDSEIILVDHLVAVYQETVDHILTGTNQYLISVIGNGPIEYTIFPVEAFDLQDLIIFQAVAHTGIGNAHQGIVRKADHGFGIIEISPVIKVSNGAVDADLGKGKGGSDIDIPLLILTDRTDGIGSQTVLCGIFEKLIGFGVEDSDSAVIGCDPKTVKGIHIKTQYITDGYIDIALFDLDPIVYVQTGVGSDPDISVLRLRNRICFRGGKPILGTEDRYLIIGFKIGCFHIFTGKERQTETEDQKGADARLPDPSVFSVFQLCCDHLLQTCEQCPEKHGKYLVRQVQKGFRSEIVDPFVGNGVLQHVFQGVTPFISGCTVIIQEIKRHTYGSGYQPYQQCQ